MNQHMFTSASNSRIQNPRVLNQFISPEFLPSGALRASSKTGDMINGLGIGSGLEQDDAATEVDLTWNHVLQRSRNNERQESSDLRNTVTVVTHHKTRGRAVFERALRSNPSLSVQSLPTPSASSLRIQTSEPEWIQDLSQPYQMTQTRSRHSSGNVVRLKQRAGRHLQYTLPIPSGADEPGAMGFGANASSGSTAHQLPPIQQGHLDLYRYIPPEQSAFSNPTTPVPAMTGSQNIENGQGGSTHALRHRAHDRAGEHYGPSQGYYGPAQSGAEQPYSQILAPGVTPTTSTSCYGPYGADPSSSQYIARPQGEGIGRTQMPMHGTGTSLFQRDRSYSKANAQDGRTVHRHGPSVVQRNAPSSEVEFQPPPLPIATPHIQSYQQIEMPRVPSDTNTGGIFPAPGTRPMAGSMPVDPSVQTGDDTQFQYVQHPVYVTQSRAPEPEPCRSIETAQIPDHLGESEGVAGSGSRPIAGRARYAKKVHTSQVPSPAVRNDVFIDQSQETKVTLHETENGGSTGGKTKQKKRSRAADAADGAQPKPKKKNKGKQKAREHDEAGDVAHQTETRRPTNVIPLEPAALYLSYDAERDAQRVHDENYYPFAYVFPAAGPDGRDVVYRLTDETAAPVPEEDGCVYELVYIVSDVPWAYTQGATPDGPLVLRQTPSPESELPITIDGVYRKYTARIAVVPLKTDSTPGTTRTRKLGDGDVECAECGRPHKDSAGAKNAHQKRWHNDWITSISMNEYACILCGNAVHTEPDQFRRHRKGEEGFRQCSYVVESEGWVHRMGVWLVMHYPELVLMGFRYWQFGYDFRDQLRDWWAEETIARTATWLWYEHVGRQQVVVQGNVQVEIGMPLWQYYIHDLGLEMAKEGEGDEDGDGGDEDAGNAEE
ncbi:hypothetical protein EXIGLDRAFT_749988 [Exidia glandulosa HHB12029]|uniref:Uncharacterized protein n=1 Tax=Exidia glandulosa HHB12029 TaxID=1314781 RepID=A0A165HCM9_EXIGL|nr:hypothetical protein EXIGLDRAFT_749988 [Exidia glandulosa HHB12029]